MSFEDLIQATTKEEIEEAIYGALAARGVETTGWKVGGVARTIIEGVSIVGAGFSSLQEQIARQGFLDLATGEWLRWLAFYVYGVEKLEGSFATGEIRLDNTSGFIYAGGVGDLIVASSATGKQYRNTAPYSINAMEVGVIVPVEAVELGTGSNANPGTIDTLVTPLPGVNVTNDAAIIGSDEETDPQLRERCRAKLGSLSPFGPGDAYRFAAFSATRPDGTSIGVNRVKIIPDGFGNVDAYVADADVTLDPGDLAIVDEAMQRLAAPLAITLNTFNALPVAVPLELDAWFDSAIGLDAAEITDLLTTAHTDYMAAQPIGGDVIPPNPGRIYLSAIGVALGAAKIGDTGNTLADFLIRLSITNPAGDVPVAFNEAPVASLPITANITLVTS